ncbi:uncharacterized protein LOC130726303 [Lotus japonicus]|uniref:Serine-rich protein-like protein n=1 Tax=Lotus japonicus TaxID=34305 RepID=I3SRP8_LOTJA|nr:uncharacterized protein LOC130726303 [Lotus japonicus]AFK42940.1 unknown [Lotus japonicus]
MAASSRKSSGPVLRPPSPAGRFTASGFASSTSTFSSHSTSFFHRSTSPTRVNHCGSSLRFSLDRSVSPNRSISVAGTGAVPAVTRKNNQQKRTCMCAPTSHPGSFRCSLHKSSGSRVVAAPYSPNRLNARRSAMTNSLVRIRGVEGELVKKALAALIRPSSHQQRRRGEFRPRPSRLAAMSKAEGEGDS